jgi:branched-subunit amino acid permease
VPEAPHTSGVWGRDKPRKVFPPKRGLRTRNLVTHNSVSALTTALGLPFLELNTKQKQNKCAAILQYASHSPNNQILATIMH